MFTSTRSISLLVSILTIFTAFIGKASIAEMTDSSSEETIEQTQTVETESEETIVDVATSAGTFNTLIAALEAADLVTALEGEGPFTVFAPTDEAFAALPEGTVEELLKPENKEQLVAILSYHVVAGSVKSSDLTEGTVPTVQGSEVTIQLGDTVKVDNAQVVSPDIEASNGVIHAIDKVILPSQ